MHSYICGYHGYNMDMRTEIWPNFSFHNLVLQFWRKGLLLFKEPLIVILFNCNMQFIQFHVKLIMVH